jgi:hypothetical protein
MLTQPQMRLGSVHSATGLSRGKSNDLPSSFHRAVDNISAVRLNMTDSVARTKITDLGLIAVAPQMATSLISNDAYQVCQSLSVNHEGRHIGQSLGKRSQNGA